MTETTILFADRPNQVDDVSHLVLEICFAADRPYNPCDALWLPCKRTSFTEQPESLSRGATE